LADEGINKNYIMLEEYKTLKIKEASINNIKDMAEISIMASGGMDEFFFDDLIKDLNTHDLLCKYYKDKDSELFYENSLVAILDNKVAGFAQPYDMKYFVKPEGLIPEDRLKYFNDFFDHTIPNSLYLHVLGVHEEFRGHGIGTKLLNEVCKKAKTLNYNAVTLHAWHDNALVIKLYERYGFKKVINIDIKNHPNLNHESGIDLMVLKF